MMVEELVPRRSAPLVLEAGNLADLIGRINFSAAQACSRSLWERIGSGIHPRSRRFSHDQLAAVGVARLFEWESLVPAN